MFFLRHNNLAERWKQLTDHRNFTVAETGFGTGLNFLLAAKLWLTCAPGEACLHYVSFEKHPISQSELSQILSLWPELTEVAQQLLACYPPMVPGFHQRELFDGRVRLTLIWGDITSTLDQAQFTADAWFLDGFAPVQNEAMWSDTLLETVGQKTAQHGTFATFTAVGRVRRALSSAGFEVSKVAGFGSKREMLVGVKLCANESAQTKPYKDKPWLIDERYFDKPAEAIVVGAGLAGSAIACQLAERGWQVTVLDKQAGPARETSSNPLALTFTKASPHFTAQNRFYQHSYLYALERLQQLTQKGLLSEGDDWQACGLVQLSIDAPTAQRQRSAVESGYWPSPLAQYCTADELEGIAGVPCDHDGLWFPQAAWVKPQVLAMSQLSHPGIRCEYQQRVITMSKQEGEWQLLTEEGGCYQAPLVVFASALGCRELAPLDFVPFKALRGQITSLNSEPALPLKTAVCHEGYIAPAVDGVHHIGATFTPEVEHLQVADSDHQNNINLLSQYCPSLCNERELHVVSGNTGLRCQTPDYLPAIGPVPALAGFNTAYEQLVRGARKGGFAINQYEPGLYMLAGLGSRGVTQSLYGAQLLAAQICGEPVGADLQILRAIHPGRFALKALR